MADIAIFRINYKSDFILTLNSDAGWLTPFCIKFWTGAPSQAYYAYYDGMSYTHCAPVEGEPTKLLVQFDDHHLPIGDLKFQIGYHFTVDDFPTSVEDEVLNQASVIIEVDDVPAQVMLDLNGETAPEIEFSLPAYANEAQRIANEQARIAAEQQRIANEDARIQAEETRQYNEQQRIQHEEERVSEFARLKSESEAATTAANAAATLANEKAQLADDKATLAQAAATLANEKAQLAADKAALAQAAATLANEKAALAQQKATYAQTQGDYAKEQGDYAKAQGDTAQADHVRAEADHTTAADDHSRAEGDHTTAASDHSLAESDHTTAASDHSRAESDHTTSASDHTRAEADHTTAASDHETAASDHTRAESDHAAVEVYVDSLGAFDISSYHATGGELAKYADLTAALGTDGANIPEGIRKGGMSVKFVQSSDNSYVQFRYMSSDADTAATFTNTANWQGIDESPKLDSQNIPDSNGTFRMIHDATTEFIDKAGLANNWVNGNNTSYVTFDLDASGHNGTWHLLKRSIQASAIRMNLSSLQNGKIYKLSFDVSYNSNAVLARLSCSVSSGGGAYYVTDYYSKKAVFVKNGHVEINIQKTSGWTYLYILYGGIETLTYPLDVTISNFALFELKDIKSTIASTAENLSQIYVNNTPLVDALAYDKGIPVTETQNFNHYYINVEGSLTYTTSTNLKYVRKYTVESGKTYAIRTWRNNAESAGYALYNGDSVVSVGNIGNSLSNLLWTVLTIPEGVDTLYVAGYNTSAALPYCYILYNKTIYPLLTHDIIRTATGEFSTNSDFANGRHYSTPRFIKTRKNISVASNVTGNLYVLCYDKNMKYIDNIYNSEIPINTALPIEVLAKTEYIKLWFYGDSIPVLKVVGDFDDDWDTFNPRPVKVRSGSASSAYFPEGYRRISVLVNITNPTCCDAERYVASYEDGGETVEVEGNHTEVSELPAEGAAGIIYHYNSTFYMWVNSSFVEVTLVHAIAGDTQQLLPDYGMIAIPKQYSNTGEPTRLIIYCHGAAVNYADSVTGFNVQDLEPDYWLAEGYAVMDIEGNPFNNSDEHMSMPQAMDSYVAAYKWAIEHYNLKRDGVFLGGRSMGGGMTISLLRKECPIPLISACPNVPAPAMPFGSSAVRKTFWATHCGLTLPAGFSFQEGYIEAEKPIFLDNWDKWCKYVALFSLITDLPVSDNDKEEMIDKLWLGNVDERNNYLNAFRGYAKAPVKFFAINQDPGCLSWAKICYRMLLNSGQITELRILDSFKDYSGTGTSAHHADTQDPALRTSITTRYGEVMTNVPIVYVEMLQFWRRYEQGN